MFVVLLKTHTDYDPDTDKKHPDYDPRRDYTSDKYDPEFVEKEKDNYFNFK